MGNDNSFACSRCENLINEEFEFCPFCGMIFIEQVYCVNHPQSEAKGVCLICESAFCQKCGALNNDKFFCDEHGEYETYQGMARIFGSIDPLEVDYIKNILDAEGFHPFIFSRRVNPVFLTSFFKPDDDYSYLTDEIKILVPYIEVLKAEKILAEQKNGDEEEASP